MANLFEALRDRLIKKPDNNFDRVFWAKFTQEFGKRPKLSLWNFAFPTAAFSAAILTLILFLHIKKETPDMAQIRLSDEILASVEIVHDMELFLTFEEIPTTDEEWDFLLREEEGG